MDTSADTAAWVAAFAAVASLGIVLWQVLGSRAERIRQHDLDSLQRMLAIITDPVVNMNTPWQGYEFNGLYATLSPKAQRMLTVMQRYPRAVPRADLITYAPDISEDLLKAIRQQVGLS